MAGCSRLAMTFRLTCRPRIRSQKAQISIGASPGPVNPIASRVTPGMRSTTWTDRPATSSCPRTASACSRHTEPIQPTATPIVATNRRFASDQTLDVPPKQILYRLSKGHGGIFCQACHGSTHAEWPVKPDTGAVVANDNLAAMQLQGYSGTITECSTCHGANPPPLGLGGPPRNSQCQRSALECGPQAIFRE